MGGYFCSRKALVRPLTWKVGQSGSNESIFTPEVVATMVSSAFQPLPVGFQAMGWFGAIKRELVWLAGQSLGKNPVGPP